MKRLNDLKVGIVGLGQIGGSIGRELVKHRIVRQVLGYDRSPAVRQAAVRKKAIHRATPTLEEMLASADLIVIATHIKATMQLLPSICESVPAGAAIMDVASTKSEIVKLVESIQWDRKVNFVGGHPMAGNEKSGLEASSLGKFTGATFVLVPTAVTSKGWVTLIKRLVRAIGARPLVISADEHDRIVAMTSGLPYALSLALCELGENEAKTNAAFWKLVAGGFRSATRVAVSSPELRVGMLLTNRVNMIKAITRMQAILTDIQKVIERGDEPSLRRFVERARRLSGRVAKMRG